VGGEGWEEESTGMGGGTGAAEKDEEMSFSLRRLRIVCREQGKGTGGRADSTATAATTVVLRSEYTP
jgi:hypothetical protein